MTEIIQSELQRLVDEQIAKLKEVFDRRGLERRLALLGIVRNLDLFFVRPWLTMQPNEHYFSRIYPLGSSKALGIFLDETTNSSIRLSPSAGVPYDWGNSCIQHAGKVFQLEQLIEIAGEGWLSAEKINEKEYRFSSTTEINRTEGIDVDHQVWQQESALDSLEETREFLSKRFPDILKKMRAKIYFIDGQTFGYGSDPEIDEYYDMVGDYHAAGLSGGAEIPIDSLIDEIPFGLYKDAVRLMCGLARKHLGFSAEITLLYPQLDRSKVFSKRISKKILVEYLAKGLGADELSAEKMLKSMTLGVHYAKGHASVPGAPLPPLVQISSDEVVMSLAGCLTTPYWYVTRKLRHLFRPDWDRMVDDRETVFRNDVQNALAPYSIDVLPGNFKIRNRQNVITDIDAVALDRKNGVLGLIQLKWQDPFGSSMRERRSKMRNAIPEANQWADSVHSWLNNMNGADVLSSLQLPNTTEIRKTILIVIARHHIRFSGAVEFSGLASWGVWPQFCRILKRHAEGSVLEVVDSEFRKDSQASGSRRISTSEDFILGDVKVSAIIS